MTIKKSALPLSLLSLLTALLGACSSTPVAAPAPAAKPAIAQASTTGKPSASTPNAAATQVPASAVTTVSLPEYLDPKSAISTGRSVYFDYDVAVLRSEASALVERHGKYLSANPRLSIKIEGNTDERGSAEYNLALGQKRAEAMRQALKLYGVKETQMEATSWGSEKPKAQGHDESAWAQNRRADLQYPSR